MAVCFFNENYDRQYNCEYEKKDSGIEVIVDYEIDEELSIDSNGVRTHNINTKFDERDILIVDNKNKMNYLLKDAYYRGHTTVWGSPDGGSKTKFFSRCYLYHQDYNKLCDLLKTPKTTKIRIYSNVINELIGHPSLYEESSDKELIIKLQKEPQVKSVEINKDNIKCLNISDDWHSNHSHKTNDIVIKLNGYIEIESLKKINYNEIMDYIKELTIYIQLFRPVNLAINKITVCIGNIFYGFNLPMEDGVYNNSYEGNTVSEDLLIFLSKCYNLIPYRKSKTEIRNIPYIILDTYRGLEDNFLMFYRFIECYYKKQQIKNIKKSFISYSIKTNYIKSKEMSEDDVDKLSQEVICLRNHYVHSGYYIRNHSLKIKFENIDKKTLNPKNYTVNTVDIHWIYDRTKILYDIVIDIIFVNMLGYKNYKFIKHF